ncbi:DNA polymerase III subunit delta [Candidatus Pelagibacter sp.]|uniref:DNA polymerase III subunit delta n=1 Tax=Candidatus Pelagibacter sp. TaxID=2024849 RepID=UPI003F82AEAD
MILKNYEVNKININHNNILLFYGQNQGAKQEEIKKLISTNKNLSLFTYDEKDVIDKINEFYESILSESLFENEKIIIINRATDKMLKIIEELINRNITNLKIIINSDNLDKKSKLRSFFEKNKKLICVAFYPDNIITLSRIIQNFLRQKNISISQSNINLIANKCNGDRGVLINELNKIDCFLMTNKKLNTEDLMKLINLIENYSISELIDNCLAKNKIKTMAILNENNFTNEDCIIITRTFLQKIKRLKKLRSEYKKNNDLDRTIALAKPPIFWKDKEIIKQQINKWKTKQIDELIYDISDMELQIKKNINNSINIISDFILNKCSVGTNNVF